jgi:hypothetical protein
MIAPILEIPMTAMRTLDLADITATFDQMLDDLDCLNLDARSRRHPHATETPRSSRAEPEMEIGVGTSRVRRLPTQEASQAH